MFGSTGRCLETCGTVIGNPYMIWLLEALSVLGVAPGGAVQALVTGPKSGKLTRDRPIVGPCMRSPAGKGLGRTSSDCSWVLDWRLVGESQVALSCRMPCTVFGSAVLP